MIVKWYEGKDDRKRTLSLQRSDIFLVDLWKSIKYLRMLEPLLKTRIGGLQNLRQSVTCYMITFY